MSVVVGANGTWTSTVIALVAGAIFGYVSEMLAAAIGPEAGHGVAQVPESGSARGPVASDGSVPRSRWAARSMVIAA